MTVRIKEGMKPYTGGVGIEVTDNHVINVLLRELNNLIQVNDDNELYVDLQLDSGITPTDDFPVGVTTGKILAEDGRDQNGIILNRKTTSGDYVRFIYANDNKLYYDPGTGTWIEIGGSGGGGVQINVATATSLGIIKLGSDTQQTESAVTATSVSGRTYPVQLNSDNQAVVNIPRTDTTYTAGANIVIDQNNVISTTIPQALVYKGNVTGLADLQNIQNPSVGDTYFVEGEDAMYSRDGTQWNYVGGTGIDVSDLFNKTIDDSDDITQGSTNLFVTTAEKTTWNGKQDTITAGDGIDVTNNVVTNTLPFEPENTGALAQVLKKTSTGYRWANETGLVTSVNGNTGDVEVEEFEPSNEGTTGQVLKKTSTGYQWANESGGGGGGSGNFNPENDGTTGQVLTKTSTGYEWETISAGEQNVKLFTLDDEYDTENAQLAYDWLIAGNLPIIKCNTTFGYTQKTGDYYFYPVIDSASTDSNVIFQVIPTSNNSYILPNGKVRRYRPVCILSINSGEVTGLSITTTEAEREDITRTRTGTLSEYNALGGYETGVIYNITSLD